MRLREGSCRVTAIWRNEWPAEAMSSITNYRGKCGDFNTERCSFPKCGFCIIFQSSQLGVWRLFGQNKQFDAIILDFWWIFLLFSIFFLMPKISQDERNDKKKRAGKAPGTFGCFSVFNWLPICYPKGQGREEKGKLERKIKQVDRTYVKGKIDWSVLLKWADWKIVGRDTHKHTRSENAGEWRI